MKKLCPTLIFTVATILGLMFETTDVGAQYLECNTPTSASASLVIAGRSPNSSSFVLLILNSRISAVWPESEYSVNSSLGRRSGENAVDAHQF